MSEFSFALLWRPAVEWLRKNSGPLQGLAALVVLLGLLWGAGKWLFQPPRLAITVVQTPLTFPSRLSSRLTQAVDRLTNKVSPSLQSAAESLQAVRKDIQSFLEHTETYTKLTFTNNSDVSLHNVDIRISEVYDLAGWGIDGDRLDDADRRTLLESVHYDESKRLVTMKSIPLLPPKASVNLFIWGNVLRSDVLFPDQVIASYDGGHGEVIRSAEISGLDAFIYSNAGLLVLVVVVVNAAIISAMAEKRKKDSAS